MEKTYNPGPVSRLLTLGGIIKGKKNDAWVNLLTGLGLANKDKRLGATSKWTLLVETELESLYAADDMAAKIVDEIPEEGTREWIEFTATDADDKNKDVLEELVLEFERLQVQDNFEKAWRWARLYGGSGIFIAVDDGQAIEEPLDTENIREVKSLTVFSRFELEPVAFFMDIENGETFLKPEKYRLSVRSAHGASLNQIEIHSSRIIRFEGVELPRRLASSLRWWGDSVLTRTENSIRNYNGAHDSAAAVLLDFKTGILKIKDLADIVTSDKVDVFKNRIEAMNLAKSVLNAVVLDAEDEDFTNLQSTNLRGVADLLKQIGSRLVAASKIPHTRLLGEAPGGGSLSGAGNSEEKDFKDRVANDQEKVLARPIDLILDLVQLAANGPFRGEINEDLSYVFNSLFQQDDTATATTRKAVAEADRIYLESGVIGPDEVAISRFGGDEYSMETQINKDQRSLEKPIEEPDPENPEPPPEVPPRGDSAHPIFRKRRRRTKRKKKKR